MKTKYVTATSGQRVANKQFEFRYTDMKGINGTGSTKIVIAVTERFV